MIIKGVRCLCAIGNRPKDTETTVAKCPVHKTPKKNRRTHPRVADWEDKLHNDKRIT